MRKIPTKLRQEIALDPFYKKCCLAKFGECEGRIEYHHAFIFAGRQVNEKFAIFPLCHQHHELVYKKDFRNRLMWMMINRMTESDMKKYYRPDWNTKRNWLNRIYGKPRRKN